MTYCYSQTLVDVALTSIICRNTYNNCQKIDIRWSGGWLTQKGKYYSIDYKNGITHETIAELYGCKIGGSDSIMAQPPVMRLFNIEGWVRITYLEKSAFCIELKGELDDRRKLVILRFAKDYRYFSSYFINDLEYDTYLEFVAAIRKNVIQSKKNVPIKLFTAPIEDAKSDVKNGTIKVYFSGTIAISPSGLSMEEFGLLHKLVPHIPTADGGIGCVVTDSDLRKRQTEYAEKYNRTIFTKLTELSLGIKYLKDHWLQDIDSITKLSLSLNSRKKCWLNNIDSIINEPLNFKEKLGTGKVTHISGITVAATFIPSAGVLVGIAAGFAAVILPIGLTIIIGVISIVTWLGITNYMKSNSSDKVTAIPSFVKTPIDILALGLFDLLMPLALKITDIDGGVCEKEKVLISNYFIKQWSYNPDFVSEGILYIESNLAGYSISNQSQTLLEFIKANSKCNHKSILKEILVFLEDITKTDRKVDEHKEMALKKVKTVFSL